MATDRSRSVLQALLVQDSAWTPAALASDSSYTGIDPLPSAQPAASTYQMALTASGTMADPTATITVTTQQGGLIGRESGASFLWETGGDSYGWDAPTVITGWSSIVWATSPNVGTPCIVTTPAGGAYAVWASGSLLDSCYAAAEGGTPVSVPALGGATLAAGCSPCLLVLPDRLLLFVWVQDAVTATLQLQMQFSTDNGATWNLGSTGVLPETLSSDSTGYTVVRTRAAYANGQVLLIVGLQLNDTNLYPTNVNPADQAYRNEVRQFASSDNGHYFSQIWASDPYKIGTSHWWEDPNSQDGGALPDVVAASNGFFLAWISLVDLSPYAFRIDSAFQPIGGITPVQASQSEQWATLDATSAYVDDGDCVLVADENGILYVTGRTPTAGNRWVINHSLDYAATWPAMARSSAVGGGGLWWDAEVSTTYPADAAACWSNGRILVLASHESTAAYGTGSLSVFALGGWSSVTMPGYDRFRADSRQVTWGQTWVPLDKPGDSGWTRSVTGTPTESIASGVLATSVTLAQSLLYSVVPGGTVAGGIIAAWTTTWVSGSSSRIRVRVADATEGYQLTISLSSTTLTVIDAKSGSTIGTAAVSGQLEILASITAGVASLWYREVANPTASPRTWTRLLDSVALTDDAGATWTASLLEWGHPLGAAAAASWRAFAWIDDEGNGYAGFGLGSADFPADLLGRRYAGTPVGLDGSTSVAAVAGPTYAGESWAITARYEHGPDALFPSVAPSPRQAFYLDDSVSHSLIFDLHTGAEADAFLGRPLALAILGTNAKTANLYGWDGAAWVLAGQWSSVVTAGATFARVGRMIQVTTAGTLRYVVRNECAGWTVDFGTGVVRKVVGNTEGQIGGTSSGSAFLQLADIDGSEPTSGSCSIYASAAAAVIAQPVQYRRWKLVIPATTTAEGYLILGKMLLGSLAVLARRPSNGRPVETEQQFQSSRPAGGPRSWRRLGPSVRRLGLEFADLLPTSQIFAASPAPDYVRLYTAGVPLAALHATALSMAGVIEENMGRHVVYLGSVPQIDNATNVQNFTSAISYGRIVEPGILQIVRGNEVSSEALTLTGVVLETEP